MRDEFYIVLLSNSSMRYYPDNTTTNFVTKLPQHVNLPGNWAVALVDIHFPLNFQNVSKAAENRCVKYSRTRLPAATEDDAIDLSRVTDRDGQFHVAPGIYTDLHDLVGELNAHSQESHVEFALKPGFYVAARKICHEYDECDFDVHSVELSASLKKILGFRQDGARSVDVDRGEVSGDFPANINNDLPRNLLVYANICQPYITGDVYSRLLRSVALDFSQYTYGRAMYVNFPRPVYIPVLCSSFETIEILIRNEVGLNVPFDFGTSTLTLHFKRQ